MPLNFERFNLKRVGALFSKLSTKNVNKFASFAFLGIVLFPLMNMQVSSEAGFDAHSAVRKVISLDMSGGIVNSQAKLSQIQPGDSLVQREEKARFEVEASARQARIEQEAKARLETQKRDTVARERRVYADPSNFDEIYNAAGAAYGVDPRLLRAVHKVETGGSGSTSVSSYAGAQGPMQFLPSTWKRYGVDGNGDGSADITNVSDAIFAAAKYLKACGYPDVKKALWGYNPSQSYYNKVMGVAHSYGF